MYLSLLFYNAINVSEMCYLVLIPNYDKSIILDLKLNKMHLHKIYRVYYLYNIDP